MDWLTDIDNLRKHIRSEDYNMNCCTCSEAIAYLLFEAMKRRGLMPKLKECRRFRELKCWALGHIIKSISY